MLGFDFFHLEESLKMQEINTFRNCRRLILFKIAGDQCFSKYFNLLSSLFVDVLIPVLVFCNPYTKSLEISAWINQVCLHTIKRSSNIISRNHKTKRRQRPGGLSSSWQLVIFGSIPGSSKWNLWW